MDWHDIPNTGKAGERRERGKNTDSVEGDRSKERPQSVRADQNGVRLPLFLRKQKRHEVEPGRSN